MIATITVLSNPEILPVAIETAFESLDGRHHGTRESWLNRQCRLLLKASTEDARRELGPVIIASRA